MKNKKHVLVVEDEVALAQILESELKEASFDVTTVLNGTDALDTLKNNTFDIILLDIILPGVDGFDILNFIRKNKKDLTPVLMLTNLSQEEDMNHAMELGANEFIIKTDITTKKIIDKIKQKYLSK